MDIASWFLMQWHAVESSVQSVKELNDHLKAIETFYQRLTCSEPRPDMPTEVRRSRNPYIDAVLVSHEFADHCNQGTLIELDPDTPVFANKEAANIIRSWHHFTVVKDIPQLPTTAPDWRMFSVPPLPSWLGIFRVAQRLDLSNTHAAVVICFNLHAEHNGSPRLEPPGEGSAEAVIYTGHGIRSENLEFLSHALPPIRPILLIHGLAEVFIGWLGPINLGAVNGLECREKCAAKYWVATHDEVKHGKGLINYLLRRNLLTLREAIQKSTKIGAGRQPIDIDEEQKTKDFQYVELGSGESLVLE